MYKPIDKLYKTNVLVDMFYLQINKKTISQLNI